MSNDTPSLHEISAMQHKTTAVRVSECECVCFMRPELHSNTSADQIEAHVCTLQLAVLLKI